MGFNANERDNEGNTGLHLAIQIFLEQAEHLDDINKDCLEDILVSLIQAGADHCAANNCGETPGSLVDGSGRMQLQELWVNVMIRCSLPFDESD
jgi:hypothetical protein